MLGGGHGEPELQGARAARDEERRYGGGIEDFHRKKMGTKKTN